MEKMILNFKKFYSTILSPFQFIHSRMLRGIKSPLGLEFFLHSSMFQLHVSDFLYSQALAFLQVPSGITFTGQNSCLMKTTLKEYNLNNYLYIITMYEKILMLKFICL